MVMDGEAVAAMIWASTTSKIMVDPISMIKTFRVQQWWLLYINPPIVLMVVGIPGYDLGTTPGLPVRVTTRIFIWDMTIPWIYRN